MVSLIFRKDDSPEFELSKVLVAAANRISNAHHHPNSVGVQFIQIGNNPIAEHALKTLAKIDTKGMVDTVSYSELGSLSAEKLERVLLGGLHPNIRAQKPRYF
ncbi:hypothetical protein BDQ12DRAFT_727894 [Crucibulum laeve]|uniref:Uncharacterized protein n=1 Tax=Crucibulum laeve TaxID=68775 RepID=A0A5C3LJC7_9AGAR|nr:hypothetical protein BDQ12DRAFT_727894 [Crucibulum laeve]